ncbi:EamA family transporter [Patescibacteria group bacterium]|nr:EamA family transporter [Patescibacteria group bacterium]MBP9709743.1 EamA family transporter [Patescibacteria group bacterium]
MSWILLAILGHLSNAITFIIDKTLLTSTWKTSATYASLIATLSVVIVVASPWVTTWPTGDALISSIIFGAAFVGSVWAFFEALRHAEASRVVPIVGSLNPLFTLIGAILFLGDTLSPRMGIGFALLLVSTILLARGSSKSRVDSKTIGLAVLAAVLFALSSIAGKDAFAQASFLGVLITSRIAAAIIGILIGLGIKNARQELLSIVKPKAANAPSAPLALALTGQVAGALGFILVNIALAQGSAAIVNALQAVQYAAIVLVAWLGGKRLQLLLKEDVSKKILLQKGFAILLVGIGLWLIAG